MLPLSRILPLLLVLHVASAQDGPTPFDVTTIAAPDGSVSAKFIAFGSTLTELWVKDKDGKTRDVVLGYDDPKRWMNDPDHPVFNPIVGRYANRLKNGTFSIPITKDTLALPVGTPNVYKIPTNDHDGQVTLHGGILGWDRRNWTLVAKTATSVIFKHVDVADEGWPGNVTTFATHTVSDGGILRTVVNASATQLTPIMLTQHIYWNLDAYQNPDTDTILNHTLQIRGSRTLELDGNSIPTGKLIDITGTAWDFQQPRQIGSRWDETAGTCGVPTCVGYDGEWILDPAQGDVPAVSLWSANSGIKVDITTNQPGAQVYTSYWLNTPRKTSHGGADLKYGRYGAVAIEQQGYVDAVHNPEWGVNQIYGPGRTFEWSSTYKFSVVKS